MRTRLALSLLVFVLTAAAPKLCTRIRAQTLTTVQHLGRDHIQVETRSATYLYDPAAGGFSSLLDRDGNDWVHYRDEPRGEYPASAASTYRGLPNLVLGGEDDGAGHPGHNKVTSRVEGNVILTESLSGRWAWEWSFHPRGALLRVTRAPEGRRYWFLYEGPPGGNYRPRSTWWATNLTDPSYDIPDHYLGGTHRGHYQLMYFGEDHSPYVFTMLQLSTDTERDHISYLGNREIGAADSPDGMVVAGFGRDEGATPLLRGPQSFFIALLPKRKARRIPGRAHKLAKRYGN